MIRYAWKRVIVGLMAAAFTLPAAADDLDDLRRRLDAIEAENSQLRQDLDAVKTSEDVLVGQMSELAQTVDKKEDAKEQKKEDPLAFSSKWNNGWEASKRQTVQVSCRRARAECPNQHWATQQGRASGD